MLPEQTALVEVPDEEYCWLTFFSHAADKGREVMLEYNERAAVARVIIPALIYDRQKAVSFDEFAASDKRTARFDNSC